MNCIIPEYDFGNVKSVTQALKHLGLTVEYGLSNLSAKDILILPGVGNFGYAMQQISDNDKRLISHHASTGSLRVGICLGMQLLMESSDEAKGVPGLSLVSGHVHQLPPSTSKSSRFHLGWDRILSDTSTILNDHYFYFVHQYYCRPSDHSLITSSFEWNSELYCSSFQAHNIFGFQFHPEKSADHGLNLLSSFLL